MPEILLTTLNARYHHSSFGLRYLFANLGEMKDRTELLEFTINQNVLDITEEILKQNPKIIGFGIYIWNVSKTLEVIKVIKKMAPEVCIVLGGPEVSFETKDQEIIKYADYVICGEGEILFKQFCDDYFLNQLSDRKIIPAQLALLDDLQLPYDEYTEEDIENRVIYVEASRGCPFKCEFCLSSLDEKVRAFDLEVFLGEMQKLLDRGVRIFKFVDRTFNLKIQSSKRILEFFLERIDLGLFLHFEMIPDRLPEELRDLIKKFPHGSLQFEIGIQTWSEEVGQLISRKQDYKKVVENLKFLIEETGVHLHTDLIVGLPGEGVEGFASGFNELRRVGVQEIQVGILKRLNGTPIIRHKDEFEYEFLETEPYEVLKNKNIDFQMMQKMKRFAKYWDLVGNSGNFKETLKLFDQKSLERPDKSFFHLFFELTEFLQARHQVTFGISLQNLLESVWVFLRERLGVKEDAAREVILKDYMRKKKRDVPRFLQNREDSNFTQKKKSSSLLVRQERHG